MTEEEILHLVNLINQLQKDKQIAIMQFICSCKTQREYEVPLAVQEIVP